MLNKLYLAGPLFTTAERDFNVALARACERVGFEVHLPQEHEPRALTGQAIFEADIVGLDWAEVIVACMDGPDPDSGTCWEMGYAYALGKPCLSYRTDMRKTEDFPGVPFNLMMAQSSTFMHGKLQPANLIASSIYHCCYYSLFNRRTMPTRPKKIARPRHSDK